MTDLFDVLADETRRDIVTLLSAAGENNAEMSVGELVEALGITQPTVSKQLKVLREAGLVRVREDGQHRFYRLDGSPLADVGEWVHRVQGDKAALSGEPFIDLQTVGRATGALVHDTVARVEGLLGRFFR
jgi:DNA-binding transcriptional ArsR family regulator